jgi:glycosyltransferase involved in cell wall biosynthesis
VTEAAGILASLPAPDLSIIVPAFNEESRIAALVEHVRSYLASTSLSWELVVVDDGSSDRTATMVEAAAVSDARIRGICAGHRGKGAAIRRGMLETRGSIRFMADADLAVSIDQLPHFLAMIHGGQADIVIGSREVAGASRVGETRGRRVLGRLFNVAVQLIALPGIRDTQCGFKMLRAEAAGAVMPHLRIDGFAFDVEMLFVARRAGLRVREVGVQCVYEPGTRVSARGGGAAFLDVLRVRVNGLRGCYAAVRR